ncbi:MAG: sugar kinase [Tabrizicola sp.]|jgi:2-dehydro-3-deoxygluconokinase|nr:sugar kinase [Tabrizicola sp.]
MVELAPAGDGLFAMGYAGDTFNTAWYLRHLLPEAEVDYLTAVGSDPTSDAMVDFMTSAGIGTAHVQRVAGRTVGLYMIRLEKGERSFAYWRSASAARCLADDAERLGLALAKADLAYLSGITLAILSEAARTRLAAELRTARKRGVRVAFDPNLRPALWPEAAAMRAAVTEFASVADVVLPSFDDEARYFGDPDPAETARRYGRAGAPLVVVKDGGNPVVTLSGGPLVWHRLVQQVADPVDTTAAGDSFNAGFLAAHLTGMALEGAVANGAALAARVIRAPGALVLSAVTKG